MAGYGARFWEERTGDQRRRVHPPFRGQQRADVVVIGAGLTGCAAAYALASAGLDVIVVEAGRVAGGTTAGGLGVILPEPDANYRTAETAVGRRASRAMWKSAHRHAQEFATALRKLPVKVDLSASSLIINAATPEQAEALRREQAARKEAGVDAPWLNAEATVRETGTESKGALRLRDASVFDPVRAALALASAAEASGARIFERSPVSRTRFTRKDATVGLANGTIRTRGIVVATGEPGALFGQLRRHVRRLSGHVVVTHPLSAAMRREVGQRRSVLTESGPDPHWVRWLSDDRVLFAGALTRPASPRRQAAAIVQHTAQLMYELSVRYPSISGLPAAWGWETPVVSTADGLPWIGPHRNYPFHFFALGFAWHGDALAWAAARAAVRFFTGESRKEDDALGFVRHL